MAKYLVFPNTVAPARDGMYQRSFTIGETSHWMWAKYENGKWYCSYSDFYTAKSADIVSGYQVGDKATISSLDWRGLAEKPEGM